MLRISRKAEYGLLVLQFLSSREAEGAEPASARVLASRLDLPPELLSKVLQRLARRGFLVAERGARGGYRLARPASEMSAGEVIEALEGALAVVDCLSETADCACRGRCALESPMERLNHELRQLLRGITVERLVAEPDPDRPVELVEIET